MIVLSTRAPFVAALRSCLGAAQGVPVVAGPFHCERLHEAEEYVPANRDGLLTLDLGSRDYHPDLEEFVEEWRTMYPATGVVLVSPGMWAFERHLIAALGRGSEILCHPLHLDPSAWQEVLQSGVAGPLLAELWHDFRSATDAMTRKIQYEGEVLTVMEAAPSVRLVEEYTRHATERRTLSSRVKRAFGAQTRAMLYGFRLLWLLKLREEGWEPWDVARFLGYEDSSEAARGMRRFWGIGLRELDRVPYQVIVHTTADWLTERRGLIARLRSVNDLRGRVRSNLAPSSGSSLLLPPA